MTGAGREDLTIVLGEPDYNVRVGMRSALTASGFQNVVAAASYNALLEAVEAHSADLVVSDTGLTGGSVCDLVRQMRHGDVGDNPFCVAIAMTANPSAEHITQVIASGFDDVLLKPVTVGQLTARVEALTASRKPFVVTTDYIGPDRRKVTDRDATGDDIPRIEVPNPLDPATGRGRDPQAMRRAIARTLALVNDQKVERHADQVVWLVNQLLPRFRTGPDDAERQEMLGRLTDVVTDLGQRLGDTSYAHVSELCASLASVTRRIAEAPEAPDAKDVNVLPELAQALQRAFTLDEREIEAALDISKSVRSRNSEPSS